MSRIDKLEKLTNIIKNKNVIIAIGVFVLLVSSLGVSYASFFTVKTNTSNQTITTGTLNVIYNQAGTTNGIVAEGMELKTDAEGMAQSDSKVISIQNTGTLDSRFYITIGYDMANLSLRSGYNSNWKLTPLEYVRFAIYEINGVNNETLVAGPLSISDLPIYTKYNDNDSNRYLAYFNTVGGTSSGNSTKNYRIKTWLSTNANQSISYTYFYVNSEIVAEVNNAHLAYNVSGTVKDTSNNLLSGALISIQNNATSATTSELGVYTLNNLYPGTYNIDINYSNETYSGNLTIEEGNTLNLVSLGSSFSNQSIYTVADTYKTTLQKIMDINNISGNTRSIENISGVLAPTYKLTGAYDPDIANISFILDSNNHKFTMSNL